MSGWMLAKNLVSRMKLRMPRKDSGVSTAAVKLSTIRRHAIAVTLDLLESVGKAL